MSARNLDRKDMFGLGKSGRYFLDQIRSLNTPTDPYIKILKSNPGNSYVPVFKSEVIKKNLNPGMRFFQHPNYMISNVTHIQFGENFRSTLEDFRMEIQILPLL